MLRSCLWLCVISLTVNLSASQSRFNTPVLYYERLGPPSNDIYYRNCAPSVRCDPSAVYRTIDGTCNNLNNPLWGSSVTPFLRLSRGAYADGDHKIRRQRDGTRLPEPRDIQLKLFLWRSHDYPDVYNYHVNQFGQWSAHDITLLPPISEGPENCCDVSINENTPYVCQLAIGLRDDDPVYGKMGKKCMEFRRSMTAANNFDCPITPQTPMNQATAFIDASQLYGHTADKARTIRNEKDGKLITSVINGQHYCPLLKRNDLFCDGRDNVQACCDGGDPRLNQHFGITMYTVMFTRFHNYLVDRFRQLNPEWTGETLYQEARRFIAAANQIMIYRDYLPILLGEEYTNNIGLALSRRRETIYTPLIMPQLTVEFSGSAFRVPHNILPSKYTSLDENYNAKTTVNLNEWMSKPGPLFFKKSYFDDLLRGMTQMPGRKPKPSYNYLISNFMFHFFPNGVQDQDLLSIDIQRGRDTGVPSYNTIRELCGFQKVATFDGFLDFIPEMSDIEKLRSLYATPDDVDLIVGALLEARAPGAMVGPTSRCVIADVFYRIRYGDRFFFDVEGQPGSFTSRQLRTLRRIDLGHIFCATSGIDEVPMDIYKSHMSRSSIMESCDRHLSKLNLRAWN